MTKRITVCLLLIAFVCVDANAQNRKFRRRGVILGGLAGAALGIAIGDKGDNETAGALIGGAVGAIAGGTIGNQKDQRIEHNQRYHSGYNRYYGQPQQGHGHQGHAQYGQPQYGAAANGYAHPGHALPAYDQPYVYPQHSQYAPTEAQPIEQFPDDSPRPVVVQSEPISGAVAMQDVLTMTRSGMSAPLIMRQIELHGVARQLSVSEVIELHKSGVDERVIEAMPASAITNVAPSAPASSVHSAPASSVHSAPASSV
ncbi:MAG: glycine zipper domain-containing protein, partial [Rubripirellula sp.]